MHLAAAPIATGARRVPDRVGDGLPARRVGRGAAGVLVAHLPRSRRVAHHLGTIFEVYSIDPLARETAPPRLRRASVMPFSSQRALAPLICVWHRLDMLSCQWGMYQTQSLRYRLPDRSVPRRPARDALRDRAIDDPCHPQTIRRHHLVHHTHVRMADVLPLRKRERVRRRSGRRCGTIGSRGGVHRRVGATTRWLKKNKAGGLRTGTANPFPRRST